MYEIQQICLVQKQSLKVQHLASPLHYTQVSGFTFGLGLGFSSASFLAAASIAAAAPRSSFSAMTLGSSGLTQLEPETTTTVSVWGFVVLVKYAFYENCRNSRTLIGLFLLSISGQTHGFIIYAMRQLTRADHLKICYRKKQIDVSF